MTTKSKVILVSAGHGGNDSGAVFGVNKESHLATDLRNIVAFYLRQAEVPHITDGTGNQNLVLGEAIKLAKQVDIAVEIHFNAASSSQAKGVEVLANPQDKVLAQKLAKAISDITGSPLRGDKGYKPEGSGQHSRLGFVQAGGLIIEVEFITNTQAMETYKSRKWLVGRELAKVLIQEQEK